MNCILFNKFLVLILTLIAFSLIIFYNYFSEKSSSLRSAYVNEFTKIDSIVFTKLPNITRRILLWNPFFDDPRWKLPENTLYPASFRDVLKCPITNCEITNQYAHLPNVTMYDAIVFHAVYDFHNIASMISRRNVSQYYVFANLESPPHTLQKLQYMLKFYNLTMTYRLDSDIIWSHGQIVDITTNALIAPSFNPKWKSPPEKWHHPGAYKNFLRKARNVAWFSTYCQTISQRENIVTELREYIDVDIYGRCGTKKCDKGDGSCQFDKILQSQYKFYLAFENALCVDYISEQVYMALKSAVIPVVFGGADYNRFLPPMSYINVEDFESVAGLGKYLRLVGSYTDEYLRYFWWKSHYRVSELSVFCNLCEFLHNQYAGTKIQTYKNMSAWWRRSGDCRYESKLKFDVENLEKQLENIMWQ